MTFKWQFSGGSGLNSKTSPATSLDLVDSCEDLDFVESCEDFEEPGTELSRRIGLGRAFGAMKLGGGAEDWGG